LRLNRLKENEAQMKVENGKIVKFSYTLKDGSGNMLDKSDKDAPLTYVHGMEMIIPGLEKKLEGLTSGDKFVASIPPSEGYGERADENMVQYAKEAFGENAEIKVGMQLVLDTEYGEQVVTVAKIENNDVWLDTNHPLAGITLNFDGQIESVEEMTEEMLEQLKHQHSGGCCSEHECCGEHDHGSEEGCCSHKK
jgi:FKBP-type peptidyl-prolyl cis-trans isomerase SlyD